MKSLRSAPVMLVFCAGALLVAGCGSGGSASSGGGTTASTSKCSTTVARKAAPAATANYAGQAFSGRVLAGAQVVAGASVQVYASGNTGNGSAATALLASALTTDGNGGFTVPATFVCPSSLSLVYVVARGGAGLNSGTVLMAPIGVCNSINAASAVVVNEVTTVASAYALAQFLSAGGNLGATATNFSGLALGAAEEASLVNSATGTAPGASFPATGTAPTTRLNSLANALNACVTQVFSTACSRLYAAATVGGSVPANTLDAIVNVARNPGSNVAALYTASKASAVFAPTLATQPSDWTLFATFGGGGMNSPAGLGVDSAGNVWVSSYFGVASEFSNTGTPVFSGGVTGSGLQNSYGLAIDQADNVWVPNEQSPRAVNGGLGSVTELSSSGQVLSGSTGYAQGGLNFPVSIAVDTSGTQWVVDYGNSHLTLLNGSGSPLSGAAGYSSTAIAFPVAVAVDSQCYGYLANQSGNTIAKVAPDGSSFASFVTGTGPAGLAVDGSDNVWVANYYANSVGELSSSGTVLSTSYSGGGIDHPQGVAIDGAGNVWVANYRGNTITELAGSKASAPGTVLSAGSGYGGDAGLLEAFSVALDAAGNVWVTNFGNNTLTKFIGLAAPVKTPLLGPVAVP